jgi:hypothetical protein
LTQNSFDLSSTRTQDMNKNRRIGKLASKTGLASLLVLAFPVLAQEPADSKPSGIPWGPVKVYPEVDLAFKHNDNIYSQPAIRQRNSSNITILSPKVKVEAKTGPHTFDATYKVDHGRYSFSSVDNYTDHTLGATATWSFTGRSGLRLAAEYMKGHDDRGSVPGTGAGHSAPDEYHQTSFNALAGYGAEGAQGRLEFEGGYISKRHDNFKTDAAGNPDNTKRDRDDTKLGVTFFWRVMPKTQLVFVASQTNYDYKPASFAGWTTLDSTDRKLQAGVTWEAAAKTTGIFKVGTVKKDFSDSSLRDFSQNGWEGQVKWSPQTYSTFDFATSKLAGESTIGNASIDTRFSVNWNHLWSSRLSTTASLSTSKSDYQYNTGTVFQQSDKTNTLGLKVNYQWMRTVKFGAGYDRTDKTSNSATSEMKKNIFSVFVNAAI